MKYILSLIVLAVMVVPSFAGTCKKIEKCPICGAEMTVEYECSDPTEMTQFIDNMPIYSGTLMLWSGSEEEKKLPESRNFTFSDEKLICEDCYSKYSGKLRNAMQAKWNEMFSKFVEENAENRKLNTVKAKERKLDEMKKSLVEMQEQIKNLEGKP